MNKQVTPIVLAKLLLCVFVLFNVDAVASDNCTKVHTYKSETCGERTIPEHDWLQLEIGECAKLTIYAGSRWNASNLKLSSKENYSFTTATENVWQDAGIKTNAGGWVAVPRAGAGKKDYIGKPELERGWLERFYYNLLERFRRTPKSNWFELIGVVSTNSCTTTEFPIGLQLTDSHGYEGQFCGYANDHNWFYSNNTGSIELTVERTK